MGFFEIPHPYPGKRGLKDLFVVLAKKARIPGRPFQKDPERKISKVPKSQIPGFPISGFQSPEFPRNLQDFQQIPSKKFSSSNRTFLVR